MTRQARFEVVRTDAAQPWHARFRAANGRILWSTETYARRGRALNAIDCMTGAFGGAWVDRWYTPAVEVDAVVYLYDSWAKIDKVRIEIRDVDERVSP